MHEGLFSCAGRLSFISKRKFILSSNDFRPCDTEEILMLPDFQSDALKLVASLDTKHDDSNEMEENQLSDPARKELMIDALIDARINSLSGLFRPRFSATGSAYHYKEHHRNFRLTGKFPSMKRRATNMTEGQLIEWVLRGACSENFLTAGKKIVFNRGVNDDDDDVLCRNSSEEIRIHKEFLEETKTTYLSRNSTAHTINANKLSDCMSDIITKYLRRREEQRFMVRAYLESMEQRNGRNELPFLTNNFHGAARNTQRDENNGSVANEYHNVRLDWHGRLIRIPREELIDDQQRNRGNNLRSHEHDSSGFVDAAESFWIERSLVDTQCHNNVANDSTHPTNGIELEQSRINLEPSDRFDNNVHHAPFPAVHMHQPIVQQQQTLRTISEQMERDAQLAIERAIERYRVLERNDHVVGVLEMIHIPLIRRESQYQNTSFWFNRLRRQERNANHRANGSVQNATNNLRDSVVAAAPIGLGNRLNQQEHSWLDLRLSLRRIFFAVLTVAVAFISTMLQGLPVEFENDALYMDGDEVNGLWFNGMMGPHYHGHHRLNIRSSLNDRSLDKYRYNRIAHDDLFAHEEMSSLQQIFLALNNGGSNQEVLDHFEEEISMETNECSRERDDLTLSDGD